MSEYDEYLDEIELDADVYEAIAEIIQGDNQLHKKEFDLVGYINEQFPTEQSLSNIDDVITQVKSKIDRIDDDIRLVLRSQSSSVHDGQVSLAEAQNAIVHLFTQVKEIKLKAERSEDMVKEITRDIKQLDIAKKNLTISITTLNYLFILVESVESLEVLLTSKSDSFSETAVVLERVNNVIDKFEAFMHIEQIDALCKRVKSIKFELITKVKREFEEQFSNPFTKIDLKNGVNLCRIVDVLDVELKNNLIKWFIKQELSEYCVLFQENQENSWLDKIDRRYSWIKKTLGEFEEKFSKMFPSNWEMSERLAVEFCDVTKRELSNLMTKRKPELDMKLLMFAIQRTSAFEQLLNSRFLGKTLKATQEANDETWKPFIGHISTCFETHFDIYLSYTEHALNDLLSRFQEDLKQTGFPRILNEESTNIHGSSADLFVFYKNCMTQCLQLFPSKSLLVRLSFVFQKYLKEYCNRLLNANLPRLATGLGSSFSSAATSLIQNLQIQTILKDTPASMSETKKLNESEICRVCSILSTAEYCMDTIQQLEDKLKEKSGKIYGERINFSLEMDVFSCLISNCIHLLVQDLDNSCEPALVAMVRLPWQSIEVVGDQSGYVSAMLTHLKANVPLIRDNLSNSRKYFTQFCIKFVNNLIPKFINNLFKCKLISPIGIEQLLLDTHSLKIALLNLPNYSSNANTNSTMNLQQRKAPASLTKIVSQGMHRAEMILKCIMSPSEPINAFVDNYIKLVNDYDLNAFKMLLEMKGITKKNDQNVYIDLFRTKIPTTELSAQQVALSDDSSKLKQFDKLQELIRKKL